MSNTIDGGARAFVGGIFAIALALGAVTLMPLSASAAPLTVTSDADAGAGTLRNVISGASSGATIEFAAAVNSVLLESTIEINVGLTIDGANGVVIGRGDPAAFTLLDFTPESANQSLSITQLVFDGSGGTGAALAVASGAFDPGTVSLVGVEMGNFDSPSGGAFEQTAGTTVEITDSRFDNNDGTPAGPGGVSIDGVSGAVTIDGTVFDRNSTDECGGALGVSDAASLTVTSSTFIENSAGSGGALCVKSMPNAVVSDSTVFTDNEALFNGGAVFVEETDILTVAESTFTDNTAQGTGGAIALAEDADAISVTSGSFVGNSAVGPGGAISADKLRTDSNFTDVAFEGNSAQDSGGAIAINSIDGAELLVLASTVQNSRSFADGGGLFVAEVTDAAGSGLSIRNSTFADNRIDFGCGCIGSSISVGELAAPFDMLNSTVDDDAVGNGEYAVGFFLVDGVGPDPAITLRHSTVVGPGGLIVFLGDTGGVDVTHSIVSSVDPAFNSVSVVAPAPGFSIDLSWSILSDTGDPDVVNGAGNQFSVTNVGLGALADNGGPTMTRLPGDSSAAHNTGDPSIVLASSVFDQRLTGFRRQVQTIDIGAVEIQTLQLAATGATVNPVILSAGGILLLGGIAALLVTARRRRSQ